MQVEESSREVDKISADPEIFGLDYSGRNGVILSKIRVKVNGACASTPVHNSSAK